MQSRAVSAFIVEVAPYPPWSAKSTVSNSVAKNIFLVAPYPPGLRLVSRRIRIQAQIAQSRQLFESGKSGHESRQGLQRIRI